MPNAGLLAVTLPYNPSSPEAAAGTPLPFDLLRVVLSQHVRIGVH